MQDRDPLGETFSAFWESLTPLERAAFIHGIASLFRGVQTPPGPIYHYTSSEAFAQIIQKREMWATNAAYLNDVGELSYPMRLAKAVIDEVAAAEDNARIREFISGIASDLEEHAIYKAWYITSLSTRGNLLSQWRAYCPRGGYSIGFDPGAFSHTLKQSHLLFGPVNYRPASQEAAIRKVIADWLIVVREIRSDRDAFDAQFSRESQLQLALSVGEALIFFKSEAFREEREWRVALLDITGEATKHFRDRNGVLTPYVVIPIGGPNNRLPLISVYVSPLGDSQLAAHAAELCLAGAQYPNPGAIIHAPKYSLRF
jgi:hypothetical protein